MLILLYPILWVNYGSLAGVKVFIINKTGKTTPPIVMSCSGQKKLLTGIKPGESKSIRLYPDTATSVFLKLEHSPVNTMSYDMGAYLESGYSGKIVVALAVDFKPVIMSQQIRAVGF